MCSYGQRGGVCGGQVHQLQVARPGDGQGSTLARTVSVQRHLGPGRASIELAEEGESEHRPRGFGEVSNTCSWTIVCSTLCCRGAVVQLDLLQP